MSMAVSNDKKENSIYFIKDNLLKNQTWKVTEGSAVFGDTISLGAGSEIRSILNYGNGNYLSGQYLKIECKPTCEDNTVTSLLDHNISVSYIITYLDNEEKESIIVNSFYPTYVFETDYKKNHTIIEIPSNTVISIEVIVNNLEEFDIEILDIALYSNTIISEESLKEKVDNYLGSGVNLIIPIVDKLPDVSTVRDGTCVRLRLW